jgi:peptidoglycan/LPS O-acetylase OafA/YrhL
VRYGSTPVWQELLTHLLFIHTWWQSTYGSINGVLWTLAVEVEFYLLFPLVWFCFRRRPLVTAGAMILVALAWRTWTAHCCFATTFPVLAENLPGYLDLFACGMLCAWAYVKFGERIRGSRWTWAMPVFALAGVVALGELLFAIFGYRLAPNWEIAGMLRTRALYGIAFAVIAFASLCSPRVWQVLLANPPLRFLAVISYNLYLYHQIVARELMNWHVPGYTGDPHADPRWQLQFTIIAVVATIAQAALVTYLFERPVMNLRWPRPLAANKGHLPTV